MIIDNNVDCIFELFISNTSELPSHVAHTHLPNTSPVGPIGHILGIEMKALRIRGGQKLVLIVHDIYRY